MNRSEFGMILSQTFETLEKLNQTKGKEYATDEEILGDFIETAAALGTTPTQALMTYLTKHWRAINSYARTHKVLSEPIEGRIDDAILYLILLKALIASEAHDIGKGPKC